MAMNPSIFRVALFISVAHYSPDVPSQQSIIRSMFIISLPFVFELAIMPVDLD
jgi:hypothetical protein